MRNRSGKKKVTKEVEGYDASDDDEDKIRIEIKEYIPFYEVFDLDKKHAFLMLALWRLFCTLTMTKMLVHPDELY